MKKKALTILLLSVALSLSACGQSANNTDNNKDVEELESRIAELEKENDELKGQSDNNKDVEELESRIAELEKENNELKGQSDTTQTSESPKSELDNFVAETSGICGADLTWEYGKGILYIHGTGAMSDYNVYSLTDPELPTPWLDIREKIAKVIIEDGCTSIGDCAFKECNALSSIEIPNTVTTIGEDAFYGCCNLRNITIPDGVVTIGYRAFVSCFNLKSVTIPDSVIEFGNAYGGTGDDFGGVFNDVEIIYNGTVQFVP
ncbi:MAG: leucine-rich repeat protein [Butyrivibrio sp.]|nr:leucine-rich repeat protein [Butyrivibrio sp.]